VSLFGREVDTMTSTVMWMRCWIAWRPSEESNRLQQRLASEPPDQAPLLVAQPAAYLRLAGQPKIRPARRVCESRGGLASRHQQHHPCQPRRGCAQKHQAAPLPSDWGTLLTNLPVAHARWLGILFKELQPAYQLFMLQVLLLDQANALHCSSDQRLL
jgi:hypothetical protein